ncbi:MAG: lipopolysaccharide heptosyltransferase II [Desulfosarcinaceae bacterium]
MKPMIPTGRIRRLLVRSTNWIGDAVMTTPAIRSIRRNFPGARVTLLAKPWVVPVFAHSAHVDEFLVYDVHGRHGGLAGRWRLVNDIRRKRFDAAILLQNAFEAALITAAAGIPVRIGFDTDGRRLLLTHPVRRPPGIKQRHQTDYYLQILRGAGLVTGDSRLELVLAETDRQHAARRLADEGIDPTLPLVGLNPSATFGPAKQWPEDRYAALGDWIADRYGAQILIFGGPGDESLGQRIADAMRCRPLNLAGRTELAEAMALIGSLDLFITNDSGLMHVAAALDVPLIAIFGSTNPVTTGPWGSRSRVVRTDVPCSPCLKPTCRYGHLDCMRRITVARLQQEVAAILGGP